MTYFVQFFLAFTSLTPILTLKLYAINTRLLWYRVAQNKANQNPFS